jgi:hypothetical protein
MLRDHRSMAGRLTCGLTVLACLSAFACGQIAGAQTPCRTYQTLPINTRRIA